MEKTLDAPRDTRSMTVSTAFSLYKCSRSNVAAGSTAEPQRNDLSSMKGSVCWMDGEVMLDGNGDAVNARCAAALSANARNSGSVMGCGEGGGSGGGGAAECSTGGCDDVAVDVFEVKII